MWERVRRLRKNHELQVLRGTRYKGYQWVGEANTWAVGKWERIQQSWFEKGVDMGWVANKAVVDKKADKEEVDMQVNKKADKEELSKKADKEEVDKKADKEEVNMQVNKKADKEEVSKKADKEEVSKKADNARVDALEKKIEDLMVLLRRGQPQAEIDTIEGN